MNIQNTLATTADTTAHAAVPHRIVCSFDRQFLSHKASDLSVDDIGDSGERGVGNRARRGDNLRFLRSWVAHPLRTAAIMPSSRALALLMTRSIPPTANHVVELGPGTGVFTAALLQRGPSARQLTLMESDPTFVELLRHRFPDAQIVRTDASIGPWELPHDGPVDAVISGLPLLSMPAAQVSAVLSAAFAHLAPGGEFLQFTYAARLPVRKGEMDRLGLKATLVGRTFCNLPPASVYRISRVSDDAGIGKGRFRRQVRPDFQA